MKQDIYERLTALRKIMKEKHVDYYLVVTMDPHASEYINDYYKEREYLSGFTGSNGTLLVGQQEALLWTDGRYFVQAENELAGTDIILMKSMQKGVPTVNEYIKEHLQQGECLGMDGFLVSAFMGNALCQITTEKGAVLKWDENLVQAVWKMRPSDSHATITVLPDSLTGCCVKDKMEMIREYLTEQKADYLFLSKLDEIMWLFNIRGNDISCNPVAYAYAVVGKRDFRLFVKPEAQSKELKEYLKSYGGELENYYEVNSRLEFLQHSHVVLTSYKDCSYAAKMNLEQRAILKDTASIVEQKKAVKNETEISHIKEIYLKDSLVVTRFIYEIKKRVKEENISEAEGAQILDGMRQNTEGFLDLSFPTISAYGKNAAMMHYEASKEAETFLKPEGIYLVDSGGQYKGGTTDVTRSIVLGPLDKEIVQQYTRVCMGMLRLQNAVFMKGCTGRNLDILARGPLWQTYSDYKCGTGHGIGFMLNVHEGPQSIRWQYVKDREETILEPGMLVSDEPGVYVAGSHGIRIENILLCVEKAANADGEFLAFEPLTYVPVDLEGIDETIMEESDKKALNQYHRQVYHKLETYMSEEERRWLKEVTREIL